MHKLIAPLIALFISGVAQSQPAWVADKVIADHMKEGAVVHAGQFGSTVIQFDDHYTDCIGLTCVTNQGQWSPVPVSDVLPTSPDLDGEERYTSAGFLRWLYIGGRWFDACWSPGWQNEPYCK